MDERDVAFRRAITNHEMGRVRALLAEGIDVNAANDTGTTPLMVAAEVQNPDIVRLLLEAGADPRPTDGMGSTAQMVAAWHGEIRMNFSTDASIEIQEMLAEARRRLDRT